MSVLAEHVIQFRAAGVESVTAAANRIRSAIGGMAAAVTAPVRGIGNALGSIFSPMNLLQGMGMGVGMAIANGIGSAVKSAIGLAAQVETVSTSFEVLLGSSGKAAAMMDQINKFAAETPFEQMELAGVAKQLLAYGTSAENIIPTMRQLGDIAALSGANLGDLAAIYGKIQAQGRMTAETLEAFQSRGIPITRELAKAFGVTEAEVRTLVSSGQVGFPQVQEAIKGLTGEGGQFAGGMEKLSKTTAGLWSTVTGNVKTALANVGAGLIEAFNIKPMLAWAGSALDTAANWAKGMAEFIVFVRENWRLALAIMIERGRLFILNTWERIKAFAQNFVIAVGWFADNWQSVFTDIFNATTTIVSNLFENLKNIWTAFWDWIKTGNWNFEWKGLTEGFQSSIKQWPAFVEANTKESTEKLDALMGEWNARWKQFQESRAKPLGEGESPTTTPSAAPTGAASPTTGMPPASKMAESRGAGASFVGFAALAREMQQKAFEDLQKKATEAAQKTAEGITQLASAADAGAIRVKVENPIPAVYG